MNLDGEIDEAELRARLAELTLDEKVRLLTGADLWSMRPIERIGLRAIVMSDGPNGVRGTSWDEREPSLLFPNPSALAATWDPVLAAEAGRLAGAQAGEKGVHVLLAPTVNLHRTPLGGRHFECYSEDPLLTARIAVAYVGGVQSMGVAATIKHFVGNDSETERMSYDARIGERPLRELYLRPFREAVRAGVWAVMAAYNGVNGATMTENRPLLTGVLKGEWGFDGVVVSDWTAIRSTEASATAGVDVEMPGLPGSPWRDRLAAAVRAGRVPAELIDDKVLRILRLAARVGALTDAPAPATGVIMRSPAPAVGQRQGGRWGGSGEGSHDPPGVSGAARRWLRALAGRAAVLLRNDGVLPLDRPARVALLGPGAVRFAAQGGGSAHVNPAHVVTPAEGLPRALPDAEIEVRAGAYPHERLAELPLEITRDGVRLDYLDAAGEVLLSERRRAASFLLAGRLPAGTREIVLRAEVIADVAGPHAFSVAGLGSYDLTVGETRGSATLTAGERDPVEALMRPPEHRVTVDLAAGAAVPLEVRHRTNGELFEAAFRIGYQAPHLPEDEELAAAADAARRADVAIVVVGTSDEVESEGFDRTTLALPGRQDDLVRAVAAANPRTVVVVNAGAPVLMPWRDRVAAVLWAWLPGQEGGDAIADVLTGAAEPGGRLPTTFPMSEAGLLSPAPSEGVLDYAEGMLVGYRHYFPDDVAFPFGHGLGYTDWAYEAVTINHGAAEVVVRNTGDRPGREVVQCYLESESSPTRLAGFATVTAEPGRAATATVALDTDPAPRPGDRLRIGRSIADLRLIANLPAG